MSTEEVPKKDYETSFAIIPKRVLGFKSNHVS